jgi:hypothetical protein
MDKDIPNEDLLKYIDKEMTSSEEQVFEERLQTDPVLKQELEKLLLIKNAVAYYGIYNQVKDARALKEAELNQSKNIPGKKAKVIKMSKPLRISLIAAASILLILTGSLSYFIIQLSPDKVFNENYVSYNVNSLRSSQNKMTKVEEAYFNRDFNDAIKSGSESNLTPQDELLKGISYLQLNQLPAAIELFNKILRENDNNFKQDAEYYLALTYIKNKEYTNALPILLRIRRNTNHLYYNAVTQKLIRDVKILRWKQ